jgi:isovaleryl-CoA dehydrogenase
MPMNSQLRAALDSIIATRVAPAAAKVDSDGVFPRPAVSALRDAGILALTGATDVGGGGGSLPEVVEVIEALARACGSTAMIVLMHYAATAVIEAHGSDEVRRGIVTDGRLASLAFSEVGSRSHFWAPVSTATASGDQIRLDAKKSWVTAAGEADVYVWSSRPVEASGPMSLWAVPADAEGLVVSGEFDGFGLRGNASKPIVANGVVLAPTARLGADGAGLDIALSSALPTFLLGSAAFSLGLMESLLAQVSDRLSGTRLEHLGVSMAEQILPRTEFARLRIKADITRAFLADTLAALAGGREDAMLRVLEVKAVASDAAAEVADGVLRLGGGAAFRKELPIERIVRDALAARVMAPTTEALLDFVGRASLGLPLFDA